MLFNTLTFLVIFLPIVVLGYASISRRLPRRFATAWLVACSLAYYGWWNPIYLWLIGSSILINFLLGRTILRVGSPRWKRALLVAGIALNLGGLAWFKYAGFLTGIIDALTGSRIDLPAILLPVGISFFTFQQIAYLVDSTKEQAREYSLLDYTLFVTFFPQLIAGPIVHHEEVMPQIERKGRPILRARNLAIGGTIFIVGLFKKVMLADSVEEYSAPVFDAAERGFEVGMADAWLGAVAYALRLYFDFSGYSDMAIGLARLFGIRLPLNFHSPYKACSVVDFWRRWHMTLSRFLRDYLYIPLGGNRKGPLRRYGNLMTTMVLGGLWHGAGWTYVLWGAVHGVLLCINHFWKRVADRLAIPASSAGSSRRLAARLLTFIAVVVAWVLFRAPDFPSATVMLSGLSGLNGWKSTEVLSAGHALLVVSTLLAIVWLLPNTQQWMRRWKPAHEYSQGGRSWVRRDASWCTLEWKPNVTWAVLVGIMGVVALLHIGRVSEFIYYQF